MKCPHCGHDKSRVTETRAADEADRRIRLCLGCAKTFTTFERVAIYAGRSAGYVEVGQTKPVLEVVPDPQPVKTAARFKAAVDDDLMEARNICSEARELLVQWWNEARWSKHKGKATWTEAAWQASVGRVADLAPAQQVALCTAGVEFGWQALKAEYLRDGQAQLPRLPRGDGRPMPTDPAMLAALESWPA
ncbi:MAG: hypothetical protein VKI63_04390 [Cyanobium sp.]|nr:hypothetical protein [Cyanobium sp.]